jgi:hypothetical protein
MGSLGLTCDQVKINFPVGERRKRSLEKGLWSQEHLVSRAFGPKSVWSQERLSPRAFGPKSVWSQERLVPRAFGPKSIWSQHEGSDREEKDLDNNVFFSSSRREIL